MVSCKVRLYVINQFLPVSGLNLMEIVIIGLLCVVSSQCMKGDLVFQLIPAKHPLPRGNPREKVHYKSFIFGKDPLHLTFASLPTTH